MQLQKFLLFLLTVALIAISDVESDKGDWQMMFSHNINLKPKQYHIPKARSTEAVEKSTKPKEISITNDSKSVMSNSLSTKAHQRIAEHYPIGKKNNSNLIHVIIILVSSNLVASLGTNNYMNNFSCNAIVIPSKYLTTIYRDVGTEWVGRMSIGRFSFL